MTAAALDAYLVAHDDRLIALARDLIAIDSQIPPHADERAIAAFLVDVLADRGLDVRLAGDRDARPSVVARLTGDGGPVLALAGHIDTKPVGSARDQWRTDPLDPVIVDGELHGLGAADMKGAIAAMIVALDAVMATGTPPGDVVLALVADEEAGGSRGARLVAPELGDVDGLLLGEPSGWTHDWQGLHLVSRGSSCFRIRVRGTQGHSSLSDRLPFVNASERMARLLVDMADELELPFTPHPIGQTGPTLNRGVTVAGGTWFGVVPGEAEFACDLRTVPGMTFEGVRTAIEGWLDRRRALDPLLDVELVFEPGLEWVPPSDLAPGHPLVAATAAAARDVLGSPPPISIFPGATDAPWFTEADVPTLPSFGPGLIAHAHGPNERVSLRALRQAARIYARLAAGYGAGAPWTGKEST
ncbi:M20 family metallopeptidase [Agromyces silvae]|uniref:M20 family metallopeptidase n=1 Tax=Agromyces silvae TaxID=3388266 RepID=UPI00280BAE8D|nr:ArgE/DapE family deacylase [Agromyces protaetiae]